MLGLGGRLCETLAYEEDAHKESAVQMIARIVAWLNRQWCVHEYQMARRPGWLQLECPFCGQTKGHGWMLPRSTPPIAPAAGSSLAPSHGVYKVSWQYVATPTPPHSDVAAGQDSSPNYKPRVH